MRKQMRIIIQQAIIISFLFIISPVTLFAQGFSPEVETRLQEVLNQFQENPDNPVVGGIAVAIKIDDLASWTGTSGYASRNVDAQNNLLPGGTPFEIGTLSQMYSVTKTFTAALVLELAKEGVISLNDPVTKYFPLAAVNPSLDPSVTIKQLLVHESGYSDYVNEMQLQIAVAFQPTHVFTPYETISFIHQVAEPGTIRSYSSSNYIILGAIIENATGKPVEQLYEERFFDPLNLNSIYLGVRQPLPSGQTLAAPHENLSAFNPIFNLLGKPTFPDAYTNVSAFPFTGIVSLAFTGGGLVTNVTDLAAWGSALYGGRATSEGVLDQMINSISSTPDEDGDYLGYGIIRTTRISADDVFYGHDGNAPGYRALLTYQPEKKLTIAILSNYGGMKVYDLAKALYEAIPEFTCGNENKKEAKIIVCHNGKENCVDRKAASILISKGSYLASCSANKNAVTLSIINKQSMDKDFWLSPNPAREQLTINFKAAEGGTYNFKIIDYNGRQVLMNKYQIPKNGSRFIVTDLSKFIAGIYYASFQNKNNIYQKKFIVTR